MIRLFWRFLGLGVSVAVEAVFFVFLVGANVFS